MHVRRPPRLVPVTDTVDLRAPAPAPRGPDGRELHATTGSPTLLGPLAHGALARNETTPGATPHRRADGLLETLMRLFLLQAAGRARRRPRGRSRGWSTGWPPRGSSSSRSARSRARLDVRPYADGRASSLWVVSDLTPGLDGGPQPGRTAARPGDQLGLDVAGPADPARPGRPRPRPRHRLRGPGAAPGRHTSAVVATDVDQRALRIARFNAALNDVADQVDVPRRLVLRAGRRQSARPDRAPTRRSSSRPPTGERLVYRDSGLPGRPGRGGHRARRAGPPRTAGGWCQVLANWVIPSGTGLDERLAGWLARRLRRVRRAARGHRPGAYVELWLKDAGHHGGRDYAHRYDTWLSWFERAGHRGGRLRLDQPAQAHRGRHAGAELLEWPYDVEQPIAPAHRAPGATRSRRSPTGSGSTPG